MCFGVQGVVLERGQSEQLSVESRTHDDIWLRCCKPFRKPAGVARGVCGSRSTSAWSNAALITVGWMFRASTGLDVSNRGCINRSCKIAGNGRAGNSWMSNALLDARLLPLAFDLGSSPQPQSCSWTSPIPVVDFFANRLAWNRREQIQEINRPS